MNNKTTSKTKQSKDNMLKHNVPTISVVVTMTLESFVKANKDAIVKVLNQQQKKK